MSVVGSEADVVAVHLDVKEAADVAAAAVIIEKSVVDSGALVFVAFGQKIIVAAQRPADVSVVAVDGMKESQD